MRLNFTIEFKSPKGMLQGLGLRARVAFVGEKSLDVRDLADYRLTDAARSSVPALGYAGTYTFANGLLTFAGALMMVL